MDFSRNNQGEVAWGLREDYGIVLAIHPDGLWNGEHWQVPSAEAKYVTLFNKQKQQNSREICSEL